MEGGFFFEERDALFFFHLDCFFNNALFVDGMGISDFFITGFPADESGGGDR